MQIGIPAEVRPGETRVAATPETVKKLAAGGTTGWSCKAAQASRPRFRTSNTRTRAARSWRAPRSSTSSRDIVLKVRAPLPEEVAQMQRGAILVGLLNPYDAAGIETCARQGLDRRSPWSGCRAPPVRRPMDVLSSQANIAGYKAVIVAADQYQRFMPMLMTAAGTVKAARVMILGAGVAGLQAVATAKRLGAVIEASDVRPAVKEQVESLGAKFMDVPFLTDEEREIAQGVGGYARPMPADWMRRQAELVHERAKQADIIITTALIPGRPAPVLLKEDTVKAMKPGSVVVDMASSRAATARSPRRTRSSSSTA